MSTFKKQFTFLALAVLTVGVFAISGSPLFAADSNVTLNLEVGTSTGTSSTSTTPTTTDTGGGLPDSEEEEELTLTVDTVERTTSRLIITWETNEPTRTKVSWQAMDEGEQKKSANPGFAHRHKTTLTDLEPGTSYQVNLTGINKEGEEVVQELNLSTRVADSPEMVTQFSADVTADNSVSLSWQNPQIADFDYVRITRSQNRFPADPMVGELVYEGSGNLTVDEEVQPDNTYFYSIFVRTQNGEWSSPAIDIARVPREDQTPTDPVFGEGEGPSDVIDDLPEASQETRDLLKDFSVADIDFIQSGVSAEVEDGVFRLRQSQSFSVRVPYGEMPEVLKTILVTLTHPDTERTFSFLLKSGENKEAYQAAIGGLSDPGEYPFEATVLDYKNQQVKTVGGSVVIEGSDDEPSPTVGQFGPTSGDTGLVNFFSFLILSLLALFIIIAARQIERWITAHGQKHTKHENVN